MAALNQWLLAGRCRAWCLLVLLCHMVMGPFTAGSPAHGWYDQPAPTVGRIPIQIDTAVTDLGSDWPLYVGVPMPKGSLTDPARVQVVDQNDQPVASQVRVMARWPGTDSIRWLGVHFQGDPQQSYFVVFGPDVKHQAPSGSLARRQGDAWVIDTGPARFVVPDAGPLIREAYVGQQQVLSNHQGDDLYVIDQTGRRAIIGRDTHREQAVLEPGNPADASIQATIRREGWYVTQDQQPIARHITRLYFYRDQSYVRIEHTLIHTEHSDELWMREVGLRLGHQLGETPQVTFAPAVHPANAQNTQAFAHHLAAGQAVYLLQEKGPYYNRTDLDTDARYVIAAEQAGESSELAAGSLAGDWVSVSNHQAALTVTLRHLWQQFPKELHVDGSALTVKLWSDRSGWELDFRRETMLERIPSEWLNAEYHGSGSYGSYYRRMMEAEFSALGMAKTHEILLHLHPADAQQAARQTAEAFTDPVLCLIDPAWFYRSEAMGPVHPRDVERYPLAEQFIEAYFDQYSETMATWGDYSYLDYGSQPHVWYRAPRDGPLEGRLMPYLARYSSQDYGYYAHLWPLYARSGQRKYFNAAEVINRHRMDLKMVHWDSPKAAEHRTAGTIRDSGVLYDKYRGSYAMGSSPLYWGKWGYMHTASGTDPRAMYFFYYLRDYRRAKDVAQQHYDLVRTFLDQGIRGPMTATRPYVQMRTLGTLYQETGDPDILQLGRDQLEVLVDLDSPLGISADPAKHGVKLSGITRWWEVTGDELAAKAILRAARSHANNAMGEMPFFYFNSTADWLGGAYRLTGDPVFVRVLWRNLQIATSRYYDEQTGQWDIPLMAAAMNVYPTTGVARVLDTLQRYGQSVEPTPFAQQTGPGRATAVLLRKPAGQAIELELRSYDELAPVVLDERGDVVTQIHIEQRNGRFPYVSPPDVDNNSLLLTLPGELAEGTYTVLPGPGAGGVVWEVTWTNAEQLVMAAPRGIVTGSGSDWPPRRRRAGGAIPARTSWLYFQMPADAQQIELFAIEPVELHDPQGRAVDLMTQDDGWQVLSVPASGRGGLWRLRTRHATLVDIRGIVPVFAFDDPQRFFVPDASLLSADRLGEAFTPPAMGQRPAVLLGDAVAGPGGNGQAAVIQGANGLVMERGLQVQPGRYERFNASQGTLELWMLPNWSSLHLPLRTDMAARNQLLFSAGGWRVWLHRFGRVGPLFEIAGRSGSTLQVEAEYAFEAGQWTHLAFQWYEQESQFVSEIWINGQLHDRAAADRFDEAGKTVWAPAEIAERLLIGRGPTGRSRIDSAITNVRLSDQVRYTAAFEPQRAPWSVDAHVLSLFAPHKDIRTADQTQVLGWSLMR